MAIWNLVDALSKPGDQRRRFYLPLASVPPGRTTVRPVDPALYQIDDDKYTHQPGANGLTMDVALPVSINPSPDGFTDEDGLPDPAIRLHALDSGWLKFQPPKGAMKASLCLRMTTLLRPLRNVRWWERWIEAGCIPEFFIYENVDVHRLTTLLIALPVSMRSTAGIEFPPYVTEATKSEFIPKFLTGDPDPAIRLFVHAGAYIGTAATEQGSSPASNLEPLFVRFHARYAAHSDAEPLPMNPRELFYLLFGDDSPEAHGKDGGLPHPLLARIQKKGQEEQTDVAPDTKRMLLRPPLRTSKRVEWEAQLEIDHYSARWKTAGNLSRLPKPDNPDEDSATENLRLYNTLLRDGRKFNRGGPNGYRKSPKCNLFVWDIALRSGFRVCIDKVGSSVWHYISANRTTKLVDKALESNDSRIPLLGAKDPAKPKPDPGQLNPLVWGQKNENLLRAKDADAVKILKDAITEEGRCVVLVGSRGGNNGHIAFVKDVLEKPKLAKQHQGVQKVKIRTLEARSKQGAGSRDEPFVLGGKASAVDDPLAFTRLHVIELQPGQDPDTRQGLFDLNIVG